MTQKELIDAMHAMQKESSHALKKCDIEFVLGLFRNVVTEAVARGEAVELPGLVRLATRQRSERLGRNFQTGETTTIPAKRVVKVTVLKALATQVAAE